MPKEGRVSGSSSKNRMSPISLITGKFRHVFWTWVLGVVAMAPVAFLTRSSAAIFLMVFVLTVIGALWGTILSENLVHRRFHPND